MILACIFNDHNNNFTIKDKRSKKKKGHSPLLLVPLIEQFQEIVQKGHSINIKDKLYSFRAFVGCLPLDTFEIPYLFGTKAHKSNCHCPVCHFKGATAISSSGNKTTHYFRFSDNCNPFINILDSKTYNEMLKELKQSKKVPN